MTSQPGKQTVAIHTLPNISRSKGNQAMKFDQLIDYNMRNISLEKSYTKCDVESIPRPFSKKSKLSISLDQLPKVLYSLFYCMPSLELSKYIETKLQTTCFYLIQRFFQKTERGLDLVSLLHFLHDFRRKIFLLLCSINWPNFICFLHF